MVNLVSFYLDDDEEEIDSVSLIGESVCIVREKIVQSVVDNIIRCRRHLCPYKERKRDIKRNLMMQLTVRRTKKDVFVTMTARNNGESVYCMLSFSLSHLLYHRIDVR
jgi:hypothetical protein